VAKLIKVSEMAKKVKRKAMKNNIFRIMLAYLKVVTNVV